jgi:hypothetical protein
MNKKDYIREKIYEHMRDHDLTISNELLDDMLNSGSFAFRLLYDEYHNINEYQLLNPNDLVYQEREYYNDIWSIDGGVRFQWFPREVLSIDIKDFREERIGSILD